MEAMAKNMLKCPIGIEMTIPEEQLRKSKDKQGEAFFSEYFQPSGTSGIEYSIGIYPNDAHHAGETWIYFQLDFDSYMPKAEVDFYFKIQSANYYVEQKEIFDDSERFGRRLCTTEAFFDPENKYIVNGKMTIKMEGNLMIEKEEGNEEKKWRCENTGDKLCLALWEQENTKDFKIIVGENEITAHKFVLSVRSPVFAKMCESGMKEAQEGKVEIKDFPFQIVQAAIKLLYHQSLVTDLSLESKMNLLQFFDKYDIQELKDDLEKYLITVVCETNVCRLTNAALVANARQLEEKCAEFLYECLHHGCPVADFDVLDKTFAMDLLKNAFCHVSEYGIVHS